jgi:Spy/CpxP family protein refolding chaperone
VNEKHLRAWFAVFVVAVFMAGIGAGLILDRYLGPPRATRTGFVPLGAPAGRGAGGGLGPAMMTHRLAAELDLTGDQQKQIDEIFARRRQHLEQIRGEVRAKFETEQTGLRNEIRKVLTPDQQKRFEQWLLEPMPGTRHPPGGPGVGRGGPARGMGPGRGGGRF